MSRGLSQSIIFASGEEFRHSITHTAFILSIGCPDVSESRVMMGWLSRAAPVTYSAPVVYHQPPQDGTSAVRSRREIGAVPPLGDSKFGVSREVSLLGTRSPLASLRRWLSSGGCFALLPDQKAPQRLQTAPMSPSQSAVGQALIGQSDVLAQGIGLREPSAHDILSQNVRLTNLTNALPNEDPHSPVPPTTRDVEQSQQCPEQPPNSLEKRPPLLQGRLLRPALPRCPARWPFPVC